MCVFAAVQEVFEFITNVNFPSTATKKHNFKICSKFRGKQFSADTFDTSQITKWPKVGTAGLTLKMYSIRLKRKKKSLYVLFESLS